DPIAVVLAAGQGTRMRSKTPKVLHPICGRPMVLWAVAAARAAGAAKVVVVGGPDRALEPILPPDVELAVQEEPRGTGHAVNAGIYAFAAEPLAGALQRIRADNAQGEEYLPDVLEFLRPVRAHLVDDPTLTLGINDRVDLAEVTRLAQARIHRHHQRAGVTI